MEGERWSFVAGTNAADPVWGHGHKHAFCHGMTEPTHVVRFYDDAMAPEPAAITPDGSGAVAVPGTRFRLLEMPEVDSTNRLLIDAMSAGEASGLVARTDHQTAGRGRRDRTWEAPPGSGLMMSLLLEPVSGVEGLHLLATVVGLAAVEQCRARGADVGLKWPNDVVVAADGPPAKLAGVLAESVIAGGDVRGVVVGIGLNLRPVPGRDEALGRRVAVLDRLVGAPVDAAQLCRDVLGGVERRLALLDAGDAAAVRDEVSATSVLIGRPVEIDLDDAETVRGTVTGFDLAGNLVMDDDGGEQRVLSVGDVVTVGW